MSESKAPAVGPDRAAHWLAHAERVQEMGARGAFEEIPVLVGYIRELVAALAASGAGPTEPSDRAIAAATNAYLRFGIALSDSGLFNKVETVLRAAYAVDGLRPDSSSREQEPASDRWFTPQPVDAPPREKP